MFGTAHWVRQRTSLFRFHLWQSYLQPFPGLDGPIARCSRFGSVACKGNQFTRGDAGRWYDKLHLRVLFVRRAKHHSVGWDAFEVSWFQVAHYDTILVHKVVLRQVALQSRADDARLLLP